MPRIELEQLPDEARAWIFGISPRLEGEQQVKVLRAVDEFLDRWSAHGEPIVSARDVVDGSFLIIAVDRRSETSGCSIDRMFGLLQTLERDLSVRILDPNRVFHRAADDAVHAVTREQFRQEGDAHTRVFDTLVERLGEIRSGRWEKEASASWHARLLPGSVVA